jgi:anti-sigma factor ChrR (cupin superfamily)
MSDRREYDELLLATLAGLVPDRDAPLETRGRMRGVIMAKIAKPSMQVLRKEDGEWQPLLPGIHVKTLRRDRVAGTQTTLWRLDAGARIPAHPHSMDEECLLLEGSIVQDGVEYFPGDYLLAKAGVDHAEFSSPGGALFLIRGEALPDPSVLRNLVR